MSHLLQVVNPVVVEGGKTAQSDAGGVGSKLGVTRRWLLTVCRLRPARRHPGGVVSRALDFAVMNAMTTRKLMPDRERIGRGFLVTA